MSQDTKSEFDAFKAVHDALEPLDGEARSRVVKSAVTLLAIDAHVQPEEAEDEGFEGDAEEAAAGETAKSAQTFLSFAELYDAANPSTQGEGALVGGYWLQVCEGNETFSGQAVNKELTHLGHKAANITVSLDTLKKSKPHLVLQLKKSGSSKQARKTYQLSDAGVKRVQEMISG